MPHVLPCSIVFSLDTSEVGKISDFLKWIVIYTSVVMGSGVALMVIILVFFVLMLGPLCLEYLNRKFPPLPRFPFVEVRVVQSTAIADVSLSI
jgi:hypothetical protein